MLSQDDKGNGMVVVINLTEEELWKRIDPSLEDLGMTRDRFIAEGRNDTLEDPQLRDLWIVYGAMLTEE